MNYIYGYVRRSTRSQELNKLKKSTRECDTIVVKSWRRFRRSIKVVDFFMKMRLM